MIIRDHQDLGPDHGRYDADHTAASITELEQQYAAGQIESHAYFIKKQSLVRLYLKATTTPTRRHRDDGYE